MINMSTGKRLAKRSILGTRVVAPGIDGRFYPAVIQSVKTISAAAGGGHFDSGQAAMMMTTYVVRFDNSRKVSEFRETELIGPGFAGVTSVGTLLSGQRIYVTYAGRELEGTVMQHDTRADIVTVSLSTGLQLTVRTDEIRLLESRKSSRLLVRQTSGQDLARLADFSFLQERRRRLNSEISSNSDCSDIFSSRKRRGSETVSEEGSSGGEDNNGHHKKLSAGGKVSRSGPTGGPARKGKDSGRPACPSSPIMSECTAAMVLMDLYGSPVGRSCHLSGHSEASSGQMSPSSSGVSSLGSSWSSPSPTLTPPFPLPPDSPVSALLELSGDYLHHVGEGSSLKTTCDETDEGIVSDQSFEYEDATATNTMRTKTEILRTIYQCTWPSCNVQTTDCDIIEQHVRQVHLGRTEPRRRQHDNDNVDEDSDHEEAFYYTEFDIPEEEGEDDEEDDDDDEGSLVVELEPRPNQEDETMRPVEVMEAVVTTTFPPTASSSQQMVCVSTSSSSCSAMEAAGPPVLPLLADHCDMARPPHENPEYAGHHHQGHPQFLTTGSPSYATIISPSSSLALPIAIPITTFTFSTGSMQGKYIRLSPKPCLLPSPKSPVRRPRGDAKKCRKVYGMEQRELWCTQCKWKKACTRFGEAQQA